MRYLVKHSTTYRYSDNVSLCHNEVHLTPRACAQQTCLQTNLEIFPAPAISANHHDYFGNPVTFFTIQERHKRLSVTAHSEVDVTPHNPPLPEFTGTWEDARDGFRDENACRQFEALQFLYESDYVKWDDAIATYTLESFTPGRRILDAALNLTHRIHTDFKYDKKATTITTSVGEVFKLRRGVCQDFAHLQIACLRSIGLAARYVSGYLLTNPPSGGERLTGADASHAWVSIFCPGFGWIDLDPTNDLIPAEKHVLLAWGRDYADVSPITGVILGGGQHIIEVAVDVMPI